MVSISQYTHGHITEEPYARIPILWVSHLWITNFLPQSGFNFAFIRNFSPTRATDPDSCTQYVKRIKPNSKRWITIMTLLNYITIKQLCRMHIVHKQCIMCKVCDDVCCSLWQLLIMVTYTLHYQNHVGDHVKCPNTISLAKPFYKQFIPCNI